MQKVLIKTVNIHFHQPAGRDAPPEIGGVLAAIFSGDKLGIQDDAEVKNMPPKIGEQWAGLDAVYAGIAPAEEGMPEAHLIRWNAMPPKKMAWSDAQEWAKSINPELESHVPTKTESALTYATLAATTNDKGDWHWTSTQRSDDSAYVQTFLHGTQFNGLLSAECRVRAVSRLPL